MRLPRRIPILGQLDAHARRAMILPMLLGLILISGAVLLGPWTLTTRLVLLGCFLVVISLFVLEWLVPWDRLPGPLYLLVPVASIFDLALMAAVSGGWKSPFLTTIMLPVVFAAISMNWRMALPIGVLGGLASASPILYQDVPSAGANVTARLATYIVLSLSVALLMDFVRLGDRSAVAEKMARGETERRARDLVTLQQISAIVSSHLSMDEALAAIVRELALAFGYQRLAIYVRRDGHLALGAQVGYEHPNRSISLGVGLAGEAADVGETILRPAPPHGDSSLAGRIAIPVRDARQVVGVLVVETTRKITQRDLEVLELFAIQVGVVFSNAGVADELRRLAQHDPLTGLLNHGAIMSTLDREILDGPCGVLMIDLDGFKVFNDSFGHLTGDEVLRHVAALLRGNTRERDVVGRFGGDEFVMILPGAGPFETHSTSERIVRAIRQHPYKTSDGTFMPVTASVGFASAPDDGTTGEAVLARADASMYGRKPTRGRITDQTA